MIHFGFPERHELVEAHLAVAIDLHELGADAGELEALTYERRRDAEPGGDVLGSLSFICKRLESLELVGRSMAMRISFSARLISLPS